MQNRKKIVGNFSGNRSVVADSLGISKRGSVVLGTFLGSFLLLSPLMAYEKNGAFVGISLEIGRADQKTNAYKDGSLFQIPNGTVVSNNTPNTPIGQSGGCAPGNCVVNWSGLNMLSTNKNLLGHNQPMYGLGVMTGYKHFIGKKKWFGLRYYGFFDYGHSNFSNSRAANAISPFYLNNQKVDMYTYGFGTDMLFNIINKDKATAGFFVGVNFAGNTWTNNRVGYFEDGYVYGVNTDADAYMTNADGTITCGDTTPASCSVGINPSSEYTTGKLNSKVNNTHFQFLVNVGIRTNFFKHHGIEFGIKIPTIPNEFFKGSTTIKEQSQGPQKEVTTGSGKDKKTTLEPTTINGPETNFSLTQTLMRQYSMYLRYVYTF
ncbi:outer membrane protein [Helicobacter cetorum]|uniref:Outer membrane protein HopK n=1 Tax=Helicobacter cetorum (strain ATCC BAA-429 / MIT 00-7128) TaxID=182217 RepID=I0EKV5_HELC0|nr:outer membrane protein [Helicobacter cetorum]AFI03574.1 outer membrane protein HopK [Helicobacter cetorum MIT 00-7128]